MARKYQLNEYEIEILYVLWKAGKPLLVSEIAERGLNISTARATIRSMYERNLLEVAGRARSGSVFGRCYQPTIDVKDFEMDRMVNDFKEKACPDITVSGLVEAYLDGLDEDSLCQELDGLEQLVKEKYKEMEQTR